MSPEPDLSKEPLRTRFCTADVVSLKETAVFTLLRCIYIYIHICVGPVQEPLERHLHASAASHERAVADDEDEETEERKKECQRREKAREREREGEGEQRERGRRER